MPDDYTNYDLPEIKFDPRSYNSINDELQNIGISNLNDLHAYLIQHDDLNYNTLKLIITSLNFDTNITPLNQEEKNAIFMIILNKYNKEINEKLLFNMIYPSDCSSENISFILKNFTPKIDEKLLYIIIKKILRLNKFILF